MAGAWALLFTILPAFGAAPVRAVTPTIVSLTFDDGRAAAYVARQILAAHGMHATFYVNSAVLGTFNFWMTWDQIQDLYNDGNEIAGHTSYHVNLPQVEAAEAQRQICNDRVTLLNRGFPVTDFAYPYSAFNASVAAMVPACGYNNVRPPSPTSLDGSVPLASLESSVSSAMVNGGWVPIVFHDICSGCSSVSISQADFTSFLDWLLAQSANGVVVKTVQEVIGGPVQPAVQGPAAPPAPNGTNGLRNASLEQDANADSAPDCWSFGGFGNNSAVWTRTTAAHTGTYAERVDVTNYVSGDNKLFVLQDLGSCSPTVVPGHRYAITSWYQSTVPVYFIASTRDSTGFTFWTESPPFPASSGWTQARWVTAVIPNGVNGIAFGLTMNTNGSLTVDDLGIDDAAPTGPSDTTQPTISLTAPTSGATLSGVVQLTATASDNVALDHVDFLVDGQTVGSQVNGPTNLSWNSRTVANGSHTFAARAVDTSGNSRTSTAVTAVVSNQSIVNLLQNPSLESGSGNPPTCWALGGYGSNTYTWTRTSDAHTGSSAENLSITAFNAGDRKLVSPQDSGACAPAVTPGHTYTITAWYKATRQPYFFVYYRKAGGSWTFWLQPAKPISSSWTQATYTTPAVPAGATHLSVGLGTDGVGSVTMDDFSLIDNSPPPDTTPPTSTITCNNSGNEGGCGGFYSEPVNIQLTAVDNVGGSGVATIRYTTDGSDPSPTHGTVYAGSFDTTTTVKYRAFDIAGNAEPIHTQPIMLETAPPTSAISCDGAACSGTAYPAAVSVTLAATDTGGSGLRAIYYTTDGTDPSTVNGDVFIGAFSVTSTTTVKYRAFDNAGNAELVKSQLVQIDTTAPTSTISCDGAPCSTSAYAGPVSVTLAAADDPGGSGVAAIRYTTDGTDPDSSNGTVYSAPFPVSTTTTVKYRALDVAGNAEPVNDQLITVTTGPTDTTAPTSTISCDGAACSTSAYPGPVSVTLAAADDPGGSGVAAIRYTTDGTDPTAGTGTAYSSAFTVPTTTTVKFRAFDNAGNAEPVNSQLIQIDSAPTDTTPPTSTISCDGGACSSSAYPGTVVVTLDATDNAGGSGVAEIRYTTDGTDPSPANGTVYSAAFTLFATTTVNYRAYDNAGNAEPVNAQLITVTIAPTDTTAPTSTISCNGTSCSGSAYPASVSVSLAATDDPGGSGVAAIRYTTDGTDPTAGSGTVYSAAFNVSTTTTVKYRAFDNAGNAEPVNSQFIQIDTVAPASTIQCNAATCSAGFYNSSVSVTLSATDNTGGSGVAEIRYTTDGTDPTAGNGAVYGSAFSVSATTSVRYRAFDAVGNAEAVNSRLIQIDTVAPTSTIKCNGVACSGSFYSGAVSVTLTAVDDPGGSGVTSIRYTTNGTDPTTTNGTVYGGTFSVAATTTVKYRAFDAVGNAEAVNSRQIQIDTVAPTSTIRCNAVACSGTFYSSTVSVTLTATDNGGGSGVESIRYTTNGVDPTATSGTVYSGAFSLSSTTTVKYRAFDNAGNAEPVNSAVLQIDTIAPTTVIGCNGATCSGAPYTGAVSITLVATDDPGGSGVTSIRYTTNGTDPTATTGTVYTSAFSVSSTTTVKYRAFDASGNAEAVSSRLIQIDAVAPTVSLTSPAANAIVSGPVSLTANAADNVAIDHVDFLVDGSVIGTATASPYGITWASTAVADGLHTISARAVDTAGNQTTTSSISVRVANVNLLQNGSLEAATGSTPTCWALGGYGTNTFTWSRTSDAHSGSFGETLNVTSYTNGDRKLVNSQDAGACAPAVTAGRTYTMTAWYKSTVPALFFVYYRNSSGSWVYWTQSSGKAATSTWTQASFTTPAVPAGATNISVGLGITAAGTLTMDDFGLFNN